MRRLVLIGALVLSFGGSAEAAKPRLAGQGCTRGAWTGNVTLDEYPCLATREVAPGERWSVRLACIRCWEAYRYSVWYRPGPLDDYFSGPKDLGCRQVGPLGPFTVTETWCGNGRPIIRVLNNGVDPQAVNIGWEVWR